jgi:hypothetical protein
MLLTARTFQLARTPDQNTSEASPPFLQLLSTPDQLQAAKIYATNMLLVHQTGAVKVGELMRLVVVHPSSQGLAVQSLSCAHDTFVADIPSRTNLEQIV